MIQLRDKKMAQVRALIDKANSTTFDAERDAFLAKADEIMTAHMIERWELELARPVNEREKPEMREFDMGRPIDHDLWQAQYSIFRSLARMCRVIVHGWASKKKLYGYQSDLDYLEMLYTSALLHMTQNLAPKPVPGVPWERSMALLKWSGKTWEQVHYVLSAAELPDYPFTGKPWERRFGVKFTAVMRKVAEEEGRTRNVNSSQKRWRESFVQGYSIGLDELVQRIMGQQKAQGGLELVGREDAIKELYFDDNPEERPHPAECDCDNCHTYKKNCRDSKCQRRLCVENRKPVLLSRSRKYVDKTDYTALVQGRKIGQEANLAKGGLAHERREID
jgi:hypothetical protein